MEFKNRAEQLVFVVDRFLAFLESVVPEFGPKFLQVAAMPPLAKIAILTKAIEAGGEELEDGEFEALAVKLVILAPKEHYEQLEKTVSDVVIPAWQKASDENKQKFWHYVSVLRQLLAD